MKKEKLYLHGIPKRKSALISEIVNGAIGITREILVSNFEVDVHIYSLIKTKEIKDLNSSGRAGKRRISVYLNQSFLKSKNFPKYFFGTLVHEYTHYIRLRSGRHRNFTIFNIIIEEGLAIYIQSALVNHPLYLDIKNLNEKNFIDYWYLFSKAVNKPQKKYKQLSDSVYLTVIYRIGFWLVLKYMEKNPKITLRQLVKTPNITLVRFAKKYVRNLETKKKRP